MTSTTVAWRTHLGARASSISLSESPLIHRSPMANGDIKDEAAFRTPPKSPTPLTWRDKHDAYTVYAPPRGPSVTRRWFFALSGTAFLIFLCFFAGEAAPTTSLTSYILPKSFRSAACDPYLTHGHLAIDHVDADGTRYVPFENSCTPPAYFRQMRHGATDELAWLYNRTVLLVGDLVDRGHVEEFCSLAGYEAEIVRADHPLSPPTTALRAPARPDRIEHRAGHESTLPRICRIPEYGLTIASVMHYGLDEEDFWAKSELYNAPGLLEHRINDVIVPFAARLAKSLGQQGPDLVEFSSGSYDLARWAAQDIEIGRSPEEPLDEVRLAWYRFRVGKALSELRRAFPNARARVWRSLHYPIDQAAELNWFKDRPSKAVETQNGPAYFSHARTHQLDEAVRSLILRSPTGHIRAPAHADVRYSPWGQLLLGNAAHSRDRTHGEPGAPGTALWAEMMLFELHRAVTMGSRPMMPAAPKATSLTVATMVVNATGF